MCESVRLKNYWKRTGKKDMGETRWHDVRTEAHPYNFFHSVINPINPSRVCRVTKVHGTVARTRAHHY